MRISRRFISIFLSIVILFTTCYISTVANTDTETGTNGEVLFYETTAAADMSIDTATVKRDMAAGTVTYNMSPYWAMWTNYRTLPVNVDGGSRYRIDFEISIDEANVNQISSSKEIVNIMTCYTDVNNNRVENKSPVTIYKMDIPSTGPDDFVTYSYYTEYSEGPMLSSEIKFYGGSRSVGFKIRGIKFYQVDEIKTDKKIAGIYNPGQHNQYKDTVLTKSTENGVSIVTYNPKKVLYDEGTHWESTWGPYTYTGFSNGLNKGYYRVDIEVSLTGENLVSYVSNNANLLSVNYKKYTVGDLADDIDGDGYQTISYYFENSTDGKIPQIMTSRLGRIGFKIRALFFYNVTEEEYNTSLNTKTDLVWVGNAAENMSSVAGANVIKDTNNCTMTYDSANNHSGHAIYGPYISLERGKYRVDVDIAINADDASVYADDDLVFNFDISHSAGTAFKPSVNVLKKDLKSTGKNDFQVYSSYVDVYQESVSAIEFRFSTTNSKVGFIVREIRVYLIEEIGADTNIIGVYNPSHHDQYKQEVLTKSVENGEAIVTYNPKSVLYDEGTHWESTWGPFTYTGFSDGIKKGFYRVDIEIALTGENETSYVSDATNLISVGYKKYVVGDLAEDTDGDGYQTISYYFENKTDGTIPQIQTRRLGKIGFKMRNFYIYSVSEEEYNDGLNVKTDLVWVGNAAENMSSVESAKVVRDLYNCTMLYDASNINTGHAIFGPYISLDKGKYRIDFDIAVNSEDKNEFDDDEYAFNLDISHSGGKSFGPSTDVYRGDLKSEGKDDFKAFSAYLNVTQDNVQAVEFRFSTTNSAVSFIIREIRVYEVAELPDYMTGAQPVWSANASDMGSNVGLKSGKCILLSPEMYVEYSPSFYGPYIDIDAGEYKAVLILKLQKDRTSDDEQLGYFDVCYTDETEVGEGKESQKISKRLEHQFRKNITAKDLGEDNKFCAVEIPIIFEKQAKGVEFRFFYSGKVPVKLSKIALYREEDEVPASVIEQDESLDRPEGVEPMDYCDVPLTKDNVRLLNKNNATFIKNDKIGFVLENNIPGGIKYLKNKVYMTSGKKKVSLYLRSPDEIEGKFAFLQIAVLQGGAVSKYYNLTLDNFADSTGLCVPYEFTVDADENEPFDIIVNWKGNASIYIDKFIISNGDEMVGKELCFKTTKTSNGEKATIKRSDVADADVIDNIKIVSENGYTAAIPVSTIDTWFNGNDSFEIIFNKTSEAGKSKLRSMAQSTGHNVKDLAVFSISAKSGGKLLKKMPFQISIETITPQKILLDNKGKLETIGFLYDGVQYRLRKVALDEKSGKTTLNITDFGTVYSCLLIK